MITFALKNFFIIICSLYIFKHILCLEVSQKTTCIITLLSVLVQLPLFFIHKYIPYVFAVIIFFVCCIFSKISFKTDAKITFKTTLYSYTFSYFLFSLSALLGAVVSFPLYLQTNEADLFLPIVNAAVGIIQFLFSILLFKIKRFRKGMPFLLERRSGNFSTVICILVLLVTVLWGIFDKDNYVIGVTILAVYICGLALIALWRRNITKAYLQKIQAREQAALESKLATLETDNERLAKIIHKDNKLIPAMEMAVRSLLESCTKAPDVPAVISDRAVALLEELRLLSGERTGILASYEADTAVIADTGFTRIDSVIKYMYNKAAASNINFTFTYSCDIKPLLDTAIDEVNLSTILSDIIENSFIAVKDCDIKNVLLNICLENDCYTVNIYDSGSLFNPDVIYNLGIMQFTTHAASGGSGIGLMNTLSLLRRPKASFYIDETIHGGFYSKKISVIFDGSNRIIINSERDEINELSFCRSDIIFINF